MGWVVYIIITWRCGSERDAAEGAAAKQSGHRGRNPYEGIYSKRLYTDTVWITMVTIGAGKASTEHNHPDEQTMLFHTGRVRAFVGENEYVVGPDDILIIPSYVPHHFEAIEDATWTEVHGPGFNNSLKWENQ